MFSGIRADCHVDPAPPNDAGNCTGASAALATPSLRHGTLGFAGALLCLAASAHAESWIYEPMELWAGGDLHAFGWPGAGEPRPDPYNPAALLDFTPRLAVELGYEQDYHDQYNDSYGTRVRTLVLFRETEPEAPPLAVALQTDRSRWRYEALDEGRYLARQETSQDVATVAVSMGSLGRLGFGVDHDDGHAAPILGASLALSPEVHVELRSHPYRFNLPIAYLDDINRVDVALASRRQVNDVGVRARVPDWGELTLSMDANLREWSTLRWTVTAIPDYVVTYDYSNEVHPVASDVRVDGESTGEVFGEFARKSYAVTATRTSAARTLFGGVRKSIIRMDLNGGVTDADLIDLWAYLLPGERRFSASYAADIVQWFVGTESRPSEAWTTRVGFQYARVSMNGNFEHWTPIPFLGVGKLDDQNKPLDNKRASGMGFSLGATYRIARWEISYAIIQLIPVESSTRSKTSSSSGQSTAAAREMQNSESDRAREQATGGHLQRLQVVLNL